MTPYLQHRALLFQPIERQPSPNLGIAVVIPAYREPHLLLSLMSLKRCALPACDTEIIVVINDSEADTAEVRSENLLIAAEAERWAARNNSTRRCFHILYHCGLPRKDAGVGLARKIGMDEACRRLEQAGNPQGIIACFDADCRCSPNYLRAIEQHFQTYPKSPACSIHFEHPLRGAEFPPEIYSTATRYELHLRYFIQAQRYAGFPFAYHTVGSSMAVRCSAYQQQGGMNRRQAGEDFYFLHKFTTSSHFSILGDACVIPSPRPSNRVPFGTGRAVGEALFKRRPMTTYALQTFSDLRELVQRIPLLAGATAQGMAELPETVQNFFLEIQAEEAIGEIRANTSGEEAFRQRFFRWFNAFMVMKFAHFARDRFYPNMPVEQTAAALLLLKFPERLPKNPDDTASLLKVYRDLDKIQMG